MYNNYENTLSQNPAIVYYFTLRETRSSMLKKCIHFILESGRITSAYDAYVLILLSPLKKINPFWWTSISKGPRSCLSVDRKHNFCSYLPVDP